MSSAARAAALILPGALVGVGLALAEMTNPRKVVSFLDPSGGAWDPSLLFTMGGAVGTFAVLNLLAHRRSAPLLEGTLPGPRGLSGLPRQTVIGSVLFGIGWGLGGVCPGPALIDLVTLRADAAAFVVAMLIGIVVAQRGFGLDAVPAVTPPATPPASGGQGQTPASPAAG